jgi:hypothetical protein
VGGLCCRDIWVVVRLDIAEARLLAASGLQIDFLGQWCHIVAEVVGGVHTLVVVGIGGVDFGCVAEVGEVVSWDCFCDAAAEMEAPVGEGSRWYTRAP